MTQQTALPTTLKPVDPRLVQLIVLVLTDPAAAITFADNLPPDLYGNESLVRLIGNWNPGNLEGMARIAEDDISGILRRM